jgi:hypothetical protein
VSSIQQAPRTAHRNTATHWVPAKVPERGHALTACGKDIDGPCERHMASGEYCLAGLAWTRSRDLASYQSRPYEDWPPPCPVCEQEAGKQ